MRVSAISHIIISIILSVSLMQTLSAQEKFGGSVEFDRTVWDFGDVLLSDGALECQFRMKNIGNKPVVIYNVTTTCGCTDVTWSREPVQPGKTATISATYTNDEGPYPFDKALTAHISGVSRPVILRIRGVSRQKEEPLEVRFPVHYGKLGLKSTELKCGNLEMGGHKSEEAQIAIRYLQEAPPPFISGSMPWLASGARTITTPRRSSMAGPSPANCLYSHSPRPISTT